MNPRTAPHHAGARFGYRGRALTLVGLVWILVGIDVLRDPADAPVLDALPTGLRAALWIATGVVALVTAWWPPGMDRWGFMALTVPPTVRALVFGWSAFGGAVFGREVGDPRDWIGAVSWATIVLFVSLLSSWPEPIKVGNDRQDAP